MAAPELYLPLGDDIGRNSEQTTTFDLKDEKKHGYNDDSILSSNASDNVLEDSPPIQTTTFDLENEEKKVYNNDSISSSNSSVNVLDESSPIIYHYLTFETELPHPSTRVSPKSSDPPPQPDLKKYTSPFEWSKSRKNFITWLSCLATLVTAYTAGSYSPASHQMSAEWHVSETAIFVGITTFTTGFAVAPMVLAPFSEINGRYPVFVGAGILYLICQICCAVTHSYPGMLVARFWTGCGSSVFSTSRQIGG